MTLSKESIIALFRQIVMTYPVIPGKQINTFATIDDGAMFNSDSIHKTYQDYLNGYFWSRTWVNQGAHPDTLCKEYPILALEQKRVYKKSLTDKRHCYEFWVVLAMQVGCETCDLMLSIEDVDTALQEMALTVVQEMNRYKIYDVSGTYYLMTSTQAPLGAKLVSDIIFEDGPLDVISTNLGLADRVRGVSFPLHFCTCITYDIAFRNFDTPEGYAIAKCETC